MNCIIKKINCLHEMTIKKALRRNQSPQGSFIICRDAIYRVLNGHDVVWQT